MLFLVIPGLCYLTYSQAVRYVLPATTGLPPCLRSAVDSVDLVVCVQATPLVQPRMDWCSEDGELTGPASSWASWGSHRPR